jgi:hypothetical protein
MYPMRASDWAAALVLGVASATAAQQTGQSNDWKKMYDDASVQLRAAQDRKAELAKQNGQLTAQVADLQKQLETVQMDLNIVRLQTDAFAEKILLGHAFYSVWEPFAQPVTEDWRQLQGMVAYNLPILNEDSLAGHREWPLLFP